MNDFFFCEILSTFWGQILRKAQYQKRIIGLSAASKITNAVIRHAEYQGLQ